MRYTEIWNPNFTKMGVRVGWKELDNPSGRGPYWYLQKEDPDYEQWNILFELSGCDQVVEWGFVNKESTLSWIWLLGGLE